MSITPKILFISIAGLLCLAPSVATAQINVDSFKKEKQTSSTTCLSIEEAEKMLNIYAENDAYVRTIREIRATKNQSCAVALKEAGDIMIDLLIGVVTQDEAAVCKATSTDRKKELVMKLYQISLSSRTQSACSTLTR